MPIGREGVGCVVRELTVHVFVALSEPSATEQTGLIDVFVSRQSG